MRTSINDIAHLRNKLIPEGRQAKKGGARRPLAPKVGAGTSGAVPEDHHT